MKGAKPYGWARNKPIVQTPSGYDEGQEQAKIVEVLRATTAAHRRIGAGVEVQNQLSPVRAENKVKKSEIETFK